MRNLAFVICLLGLVVSGEKNGGRVVSFRSEAFHGRKEWVGLVGLGTVGSARLGWMRRLLEKWLQRYSCSVGLERLRLLAGKPFW